MRRLPLSTLLLPVLAFALPACSVGGDADGGILNPIDVGPAGPDAEPREVDAALPPRRDGGPPPDAGQTSGLQCEPCAGDDDCEDGSYCVELPSGGNVCLASCVPDLPQCPERFDCIDSLLTDLPTPVCTPVGERCCVDADGDDYGIGVGCRGLDCDEADPDVREGATELCNDVDDDCDGMIDEGDPGGGMVCSTGLEGACSSGVTVCEEGTISCVADASMAEEVCNGIDDDCDSNVDEDEAGVALTRSCYDGPAGTEGNGACTAGVQTCAGGDYRGCVGQVLPASSEACNDVDDDCDGEVDDGDPGGGFACITGSPGACSEGTTHCQSGSVECVPAIAVGSQPEICDDVDNDCDGEVNEGFPGLGQACTAGEGICRRGGVASCDPDDPTAPPVCDAVPGTPNPAETCDYVDDDCDGSTDEGFRNGAGVYFTVAHCSACGFDCNLSWPGGAALYNVVPTCDVSGSSASCGFECVEGWVDADGVRDNGCELSPEADTIYVSTPSNGGSDVSGCGAWDAPCGSIDGGLDRAQATGARRVRVSTGLYRENVTLRDGVDLLGGHSHVNWVRNPALYGTTIRGLDVAPDEGGANDRIVVTAVDITSATELSGFTVTGVNAGPGGNSIGVYVRDSNHRLSIVANEIAAGAGGNGVTGATGDPGTPGDPGDPGVGPERRSCGSAATAGPTGGSRSCSGAGVDGGDGGDGTDPTTSSAAPTQSGSGGGGATAGGGAGGPGGYHMEGSSSGGPFGGGSTCSILQSPIEGAPGDGGDPGTDGGGGDGAASATGAVDPAANQWRGEGGDSGVGGTTGGGGGGGGSPGGVEADGGAYCLYPATGGGGGSGGCPGQPGGAGSAGGASFAIFVHFTTTPTTATMPEIRSNTLRRGSGGRGGDGGTGGGGGEGGAGGAGGPNTSESTEGDAYSFCLLAGAPGGAGGRGGHAGGGGAGAGGVSYDIWVSRPGSASPDYTGNSFEIDPGVDTAGEGGAGGNSSNTAIGLGGDGADGAYGTVRIGS